jgi:hypothetical protein
MSAAGFCVSESEHDPAGVYMAMVNASPPHPCETLTIETARDKQDWRGMDGVTAWHLIDRHADGWNDIALMMDAWLEANK